ncbi:pantoate--beta-alanine ligase [Aquamicrobium segne]|uniref:Pantothenate synthetase n=1 Tax=Aquamicrobium segne TaxID=469547 RepID=A0ABW0GYM8_9HYPH
MSALHLSSTIADLRTQVKIWRQASQSIAMVPTMGALHEGHFSLIREAKLRADRCIVSIFVNPAQFAPNEDLNTYPRQLERDLEQLVSLGADLAFTPATQEIYGENFATKVVVGGPAIGLESDFRPTFFEGVATIVAKLFIQATPNYAIFGEKDYQQLCVIRQMCRDLDLPVKIIGSPTIRDEHGLALSSRNAYLDADQLDIARRLNLILRESASAISHGVTPDLETARASQALVEAGFTKIDYVAARESTALAPWQADKPGRLLAAVWLKNTRLIDNVEIAAQT